MAMDIAPYYGKIGLSLDILGAILISLDVFGHTSESLKAMADELACDAWPRAKRLLPAMVGDYSEIRTDDVADKLHGVSLFICGYLGFRFIGWVADYSNHLLEHDIVQYWEMSQLLEDVRGFFLLYLLTLVVSGVAVRLAGQLNMQTASDKLHSSLPYLGIPLAILGFAILSLPVIVVSSIVYLLTIVLVKLSIPLNGLRQLGLFLLVSGFVMQMFTP